MTIILEMKNPRLHRREQPGEEQRGDNPDSEECPHIHRSPLVMKKSTPEETEESTH